jgi:hypothetical protein
MTLKRLFSPQARPWFTRIIAPVAFLPLPLPLAEAYLFSLPTNHTQNTQTLALHARLPSYSMPARDPHRKLAR